MKGKLNRFRSKPVFPCWGWFVLFLLVVFIAASPFLFTRSAIWRDLDFSGTGSIGDTIGGITAPFVGLLSAGLLVWTLYEQIKINREQKSFNDTSRVITILSHVQQIDDSIFFLFSSPSSISEGRGLSSLKNLDSYSGGDAWIAFEEVVLVEHKVELIASAIISLCVVIEDSFMGKQDQDAYREIAALYLGQLESFYDLVVQDRIQFLFPKGDEEPFKSKKEKLKNRAKQMLGKVKTSQSLILRNV